MNESFQDKSADGVTPHRRRPRYSGKHPRHFAEKYKEHDPTRYGETVAKVLASGKTPAGMHRPIMVKEVLEILTLKPGGTVVDCTLGFGGHATEILPLIQPAGRLIGVDADPIELPKTEARLRSLGFAEETFLAVRTNFAGIPKALASFNITSADAILADLGVSSMQLDDPARGFSLKFEGPLDMRMNPQRGQPVSALLQNTSTEALMTMLVENADEPHTRILGPALAGKTLATTTALAGAVRNALRNVQRDEQDASIRRVFQALRIAVNDEFSTLESLLRALPDILNRGGRAAILTFHSGEDRRVKKSFQAGLSAGLYSDIAREVLRPSPEERHANPRSAPAKLRWAIRA